MILIAKKYYYDLWISYWKVYSSIMVQHYRAGTWKGNLSKVFGVCFESQNLATFCDRAATTSVTSTHCSVLSTHIQNAGATKWPWMYYPLDGSWYRDRERCPLTVWQTIGGTWLVWLEQQATVMLLHPSQWLRLEPSILPLVLSTTWLAVEDGRLSLVFSI